MEEELPDDVLADVLRRLPPRSLAASRCVRKRWCSVVDARRLLRADLLPLRLDGFFCNLFDLILPRLAYFLSPPSTARRIDSRLRLVEESYLLEVDDQCNGLLLLFETVVNPATRQCASLPPEPETITVGTMKDNDVYSSSYLVYDPMASPEHYEVFLLHLFLLRYENKDDSIDLEQEWPPSTCRAHAFSSRNKDWRWEERSFVRQGEPAGTIAEMLQASDRQGHGVYWRGALYVHCQNDSVMRISLSNDKYQMIRSPAGAISNVGKSYLGKSEKVVYFALLNHRDGRCPRFRVWLLNEQQSYSSNGDGHEMEWVLKTDIDLQLTHFDLPCEISASQRSEPWADNYCKKYSEGEGALPAQEEFDEWDFENGGVALDATTVNWANKTSWTYDLLVLGFHPYKEIVFFTVASRWIVSYHLNTSKLQALGSHSLVNVKSSLPYTSCWIGDLFGKD